MYVLHLPEIWLFPPTANETRWRVETRVPGIPFKGFFVEEDKFETVVGNLLEELKNDQLESLKKMPGMPTQVSRQSEPNILQAELQAEALPKSEDSAYGLGGGADPAPRSRADTGPVSGPKRSNRKID